MPGTPYTHPQSPLTIHLLLTNPQLPDYRRFLSSCLDNFVTVIGNKSPILSLGKMIMHCLLNSYTFGAVRGLSGCVRFKRAYWNPCFYRYIIPLPLKQASQRFIKTALRHICITNIHYNASTCWIYDKTPWRDNCSSFNSSTKYYYLRDMKTW